MITFCVEKLYFYVDKVDFRKEIVGR